MNLCWCVLQVGDHHSHIYVWNLHNNYEVSLALSQTQTTSLVITPPPVFCTGTHGLCVVQVQQISVQPGGGALQQGGSAVPEQPATDDRRRERRRV